MFSRASDQQPRVTEPGRAGGVQPVQPLRTAPPPFAQNGNAQVQPAHRPIEGPTSVLGPDITIIGQQLVLKTKGSLLIAGQIQGDVHGESVTVGESGSVTGTITARIITIQGEARGALKGSQVILHASSRVDGDIVKQTLSIAEGAQFDGSVRRAKDIAEVTPDLS